MGPDTQAQAIDRSLALRNALYPLGEIERILVHLQDAAALAEALDDQHRLGWVAAYLLNHCLLPCDPQPGHHVRPARPTLSAALDLYHTMEMIFWLPQAKAALAAI